MKYIVLSLCSLCALGIRLQKVLEQPVKDQYDIEFSKSIEDGLFALTGSLKEREIQALLKNPLKPELQERIHSNTGMKTFFFIGDSLVRNQYEAFCLLLRSDETMIFKSNLAETRAYLGDTVPAATVNPSWGYGSCKDRDTSAYFAFTGKPNATLVNFLLDKSPHPSVIYWDGGVWGMDPLYKHYFTQEAYPRLVQEVAQSYKNHAQSVFFLAHSVCHDEKTKYPGLRSKVSMLNAQALSTLQPTGVQFVDGFEITDGKCDFSDGMGIHFNLLLFDELKALLDAIHM